MKDTSAWFALAGALSLGLAFPWAPTLSCPPTGPSRRPGQLSAAELAWLALSTLAIAGLVCGAARAVRVIGLLPRVLDFETPGSRPWRAGSRRCPGREFEPDLLWLESLVLYFWRNG